MNSNSFTDVENKNNCAVVLETAQHYQLQPTTKLSHRSIIAVTSTVIVCLLITFQLRHVPDFDSGVLLEGNVNYGCYGGGNGMNVPFYPVCSTLNLANDFISKMSNDASFVNSLSRFSDIQCAQCLSADVLDITPCSCVNTPYSMLNDMQNDNGVFGPLPVDITTPRDTEYKYVYPPPCTFG